MAETQISVSAQQGLLTVLRAHTSLRNQRKCFKFSFFKKMYLLTVIWEREKRGRERNNDLLFHLRMRSWVGWCTCPDGRWRSNLQLLTTTMAHYNQVSRLARAVFNESYLDYGPYSNTVIQFWVWLLRKQEATKTKYLGLPMQPWSSVMAEWVSKWMKELNSMSTLAGKLQRLKQPSAPLQWSQLHNRTQC